MHAVFKMNKKINRWRWMPLVIALPFGVPFILGILTLNMKWMPLVAVGGVVLVLKGLIDLAEQSQGEG